MVITRQSSFTGKVHSMDLNVTEAQLGRWEAGELIQNVFPDLSPDDREFLMTGVSKEEWAEFVGDEEDDLLQ
jgi:hypothetical protein